MIDLDAGYLEAVKRILAEHVPGVEVRVFGSRIDGSAGPYSDLDLALAGDGRIPLTRIGALKDAFAESDLPFQVDVLDLRSVSESFRLVIERRYEVIQGGMRTIGESRHDPGA